MSMQILYQNINTGKAHDITSLVTDASWKTVRRGSPGSMELTILQDSEVVIDHGGIVVLKSENTGFFYGYVFKFSQDETGSIKATAYDQIRYLKNKDTYVFKGMRADQIVAKIAADYNIMTGKLANTHYVIPSMVEDSKTLLDIILKALDMTLVNKNQMYVLWDDYGSLRISDVKESHIDLVVGDESLATGYEYSSDIDSDTANKIKLVRDNKDSGKRDVYIVQDSNSMKRWGILLHSDKVDENLNKAQVEDRASMLLSLKNRPSLSLSMKAIGDLSVRAGRALFIRIGDIGVSGWYIVDECTHDLLNETMSLKLVVM